MLVKQGIVFIIFVICAKLLSVYEFGVYNYLLAVIFFLIMFGDFGISTATSRYVAEYNANDKKKLELVLFNIGFLILSLTILIAVMVMVFGKIYLKDYYYYILLLLPLVILSPLVSLYDGIYRGLKKFRELALITSLVSLISLPLILYFIKIGGLSGALLSQIFFYSFLLIALALAHRGNKIAFDRSVLVDIGRYSLIYGLAILGNYLFIRFGILILGHYGFINELGMYELLNKIFTILLLPFVLLGQVMAPNFSELSSKKNFILIFEKTKKYTVYFFFFGIASGLLLYFIIPYLVIIFLPQYYNSLFLQIFPFTICIFIANVWAATIDAGILVPSGFASLMAYFYIILGIVGVILSFFLMDLYGYMGVIYSFTITSVLMAVVLRGIFLRKILKLSIQT